MAETRRKRSRAGAVLRLQLHHASAHAALRGPFWNLAKVPAGFGKKKNVSQLASDVVQMLSAAQHVLEDDFALKPPLEADPDEAVTTRAPSVAARTEASPSSVKPVTPAAKPGDAKAPGHASSDALAELLSALDAAHDARSGMSFVPAIVRQLSAAMTAPEALDLLLQAARRELIELRPEGGLGRLSHEELALCPPGPAGTRLSWARRSAGVDA